MYRPINACVDLSALKRRSGFWFWFLSRFWLGIGLGFRFGFRLGFRVQVISIYV